MSLDINEHNYESIDEPEQAQVHSIYYHLNQIAAVRAKVNINRESRLTCIDCDDPIPEARRQAIKGCIRCVHCQEEFEE